MRLPLLHILAAQPWSKCQLHFCVYVMQFRAGYSEGNAAAHMTNAGNFCCDRCVSSGDISQLGNNLYRIFSGQAMKHRQVGR